MSFVARLLEHERFRRPVCIVQIIEISGSSPRDPGTKMLVTAEGLDFGTIGGGKLEFMAIESAKKTLITGKSKKERISLGAQVGQCCGGVVELFFEPLHIGPKLYLFGAGHVALELIEVLKGTEFQVCCIDSRLEWCDKAKLRLPAEVRCEDPLGVLTDIDLVSSQLSKFAVVMTHEHSMDEALIEKLSLQNFEYLGLIGSHSKWERFKQQYRLRNLDPARFEKVHCPIGIANLGKSPREVAISIAAELLKVYQEDAEKK